MTFKDRSNITSNQTGKKNSGVIHLSNLCTEILEVTNQDEGAVCNLGSLNLGRCVIDGRFDFARLRDNVRIAVRQLDRVIDRNYYPIEMTQRSNSKWRPVGLGTMGLQDVFFKLKLPFDAPEARELLPLKLLKKSILPPIQPPAILPSSSEAIQHLRRARRAMVCFMLTSGMFPSMNLRDGKSCALTLLSTGCAIR